MMFLYRLLLIAFPRQVRREFGGEMTAMFRAQLLDARSRRESRIRLWSLAVADAIVHGLGERWEKIVAARRTAAAGLGRWRWWMRALAQDLRYAARMLGAQRGVTMVAILTLALGIGANTAIFSAVDTLLLRPLPYPNPDELVMVWEKRPAEGVLDNVVAPADFVDWERMNTVFSSIAAMTGSTVDLTGAGEPQRLFAGLVSPSFFDVLGVQPALGRTFARSEDVVGQHRVVILRYELWRDRFGSERAIVGRKLLFNGIPHEVIGVLPSSFAFPDDSLQVWLPLALKGGSEPLSRASHSLTVYARLAPGKSLADARADMDRVGALLSAQYPDTNRAHGAWVTTMAEEVRAPVRAGLWLLFGAVAFVLLIACVNVANLLLARAAARRREIAVRVAVGASRSRIAGQMLTESLLLALLGGAAALVVAGWGIQLVRQLSPADVPVLGLDDVSIDGRVLAFSFGLSLLTGLLFGLLPAWTLASQDASEALRSGGRAVGVRRRLRIALVISEIALASLLLVGTGLTWRSFHTLLRAEPGLDISNVLTALVTLPAARYSGSERQLATFTEIEERFRAIPGVRAVGATSLLPLSGMDGRRGIAIEGREPDPDSPTRAHPRSVTPGYFEAIGIRLESGRFFTAADRADSPPVVIVNETMARRYWPGRSPIGRRLTLGGRTEWREVIGVVRDVRHWGLDQPVNPEMYLPLAQMTYPYLSFVIATPVEPASLAPAVREQLRAVDPDLPLSSVRTMEQVAARSVESRSSALRLLGVFSLLAIVLASAGIYGVMMHLVALRTGEIGVRMTLGARPGDVLRLILREGAMQAVAGLALGLCAGVLLMRGFRSMLYEISPADPVTLAAVVLVLLAAALLACLVPARRAMKVDPVTALRQ